MQTHIVDVPGYGRVKTLTPMTAEEVLSQFKFVADATDACEAVSEADEIDLRHSR